ncbi:MAG: hypothetical protein ACHQF2_00655 [Flavobacteriales bacterium]
MILFVGIALGFGLGYLLCKFMTIKSKPLIYVVAVLLVFITMFGVALLHVKFGAQQNVSRYQDVLTARQYDRLVLTFSERLGRSMGTTLAWFLLGYLALGTSFVWYQLQKQKPQQ